MRTPHERYYASPKAAEPTPPPVPELVPARPREHTRIATDSGVIRIAHLRIQMGRENGGRSFNVVEATTIHIFDAQGTHIVTHPKAAKGTYLGNGKPRGFLATQVPRFKPTEPSATS